MILVDWFFKISIAKEEKEKCGDTDTPLMGAAAKNPARRDPIMKFNDQSRHCHAEPFASLKGKLREASVCPSRETLRFTEGDKPLPILIVKILYRG
jgi:hypothetical protein